MKTTVSTFALLLFTFFFTDSHAQPKRVPNQILVQCIAGANPEFALSKYTTLNGENTGLIVAKLLSRPMNIYLLEFDESSVNAGTLIKALKDEPKFQFVQYNHYVHNRETVPNDPGISEQWHHVNTGQGNGTPDADIDSDLAWDITRGGNTALGDSIVVCIIEGGNLNHPDLIGNKWENYLEIPNNGIDDDGNGYVDDFRGWNVADEDDVQVYSGGHGTNVMGMIGAMGNNNFGTVGANWKVKMMSVAGESAFDEASVVQAYTYPLVQRRLYDSTNGALGAFVVATNASWGIDFGQPDDVPIWSAFYDTLGAAGILSCGATTNQNVDVDEVNDIPTGVESEYMVSVTATDNQDVRTFSGFGQTTVDLGAPGDDVFTSSGQGGTTITSGTSFASPLTAGVIALLYSIPCANFATFAREDPQGAAVAVREALFQGVDPVANLTAETVTGGRLNSYNSILLLMNEFGCCTPPLSFSYTVISDTIYSFGWEAEADATFRYRLLGADEWTSIPIGASDSLSINDFEFCSSYEVQVGSPCATSGDSIVYTVSSVIEILGCCVAPQELAGSVDSILSITWQTAFNVSSYIIYFQEAGDDNLLQAGTSANGEFQIEGLEDCTFYNFLVVPACSDSLEGGSEIMLRTSNCGHCIDADYCSAFGESSFFEYIESLSFDEVEFLSGNDGGYSFLENVNMTFERGQEIEMILSPGFSGFAFSEFFKVWLDADQDGIFDDDTELLLVSPSASSDVVTDTILIPIDAALGSTRLRVSMKYIGGENSSLDPCEVYDEGETEDYCVQITESTLNVTNEKPVDLFKLFPNPSPGSISIVAAEEWAGSGQLIFSVYDLTGKKQHESLIYGSRAQVELELGAGTFIYTLTNASSGWVQRGKLVLVR